MLEHIIECNEHIFELQEHVLNPRTFFEFQNKIGMLEHIFECPEHIFEFQGHFESMNNFRMLEQNLNLGFSMKFFEQNLNRRILFEIEIFFRFKTILLTWKQKHRQF